MFFTFCVCSKAGLQSCHPAWKAKQKKIKVSLQKEAMKLSQGTLLLGLFKNSLSVGQESWPSQTFTHCLRSASHVHLRFSIFEN